MLIILLVFQLTIIHGTVVKRDEVDDKPANQTRSLNDYPDYDIGGWSTNLPTTRLGPETITDPSDYERVTRIRPGMKRYPQLVTAPDYAQGRPLPPRISNYQGGGQGGGYPSPMGYSYAGYIDRQARRYPIMMYTLVQCVPCQRAKHLLAVSYSDVAAHFLELVGDEDWQRQLQVDLQQMTGQVTFPYIFICGQHVGGSSDLFGLHQSGQLRTMLNNCQPRS